MWTRHEDEIGHSDRSKSAIEPHLSRQWFVRKGDVEGAVLLGRGTANEFQAPDLAQVAIDAVGGTLQTATGRALAFHQTTGPALSETGLLTSRERC